MALLDAPETLDRCRLVATALDDAIPVPGTDRKIGLDPIVGVLPVAGDAVAAVASSYIVLEAARLGAPKATLARMAANVAIDFGGGSVPVLGDLFDAAFKANVKNVELLERHLEANADVDASSTAESDANVEAGTDDGNAETTTGDDDAETTTGTPADAED